MRITEKKVIKITIKQYEDEGVSFDVKITPSFNLQQVLETGESEGLSQVEKITSLLMIIIDQEIKKMSEASPKNDKFIN